MSKLLVSSSLLVLLCCASAAAGPSAVPVVGGSPVKAGAFPDVVAVLAPDGACSGTLVAPDVVLTAGHCTTEIKPEVVVIDTVDYGKPGGEIIRVKAVYGYPDWENAFDVGALVLEHPATKAKPRAIARACNAPASPVVGGPPPTVKVVGFGLTTKSGTGDNTKLNAASLRVTDAAVHRRVRLQQAIAPDAEFAAGGGGTDSCFGDSGGPAFVSTPSGVPALFGVVSRGAVRREGRPVRQRRHLRARRQGRRRGSRRRPAASSCARAAIAPPTSKPRATKRRQHRLHRRRRRRASRTVMLLPGLVWRRRRKK